MGRLERRREPILNMTAFSEGAKGVWGTRSALNLALGSGLILVGSGYGIAWVWFWFRLWVWAWAYDFILRSPLIFLEDRS